MTRHDSRIRGALQFMRMKRRIPGDWDTRTGPCRPVSGSVELPAAFPGFSHAFDD
ncbi:MAG: hypothetical protein MUD12_06710 [Spirochaetes bacterium]|nr:hypothetical protein [Spirochaetota bacterium]